MKSLFAFFFFLGISAFAADSELTNYKSGIDVIWGVGDGSDKGTAYMEEYLFHNKTISDRKIVYLRDTTEIRMTHNAYNNVANHISDGVGDTTTPFGYFRVIGANGLDGAPASGDEGIIRWRMDREGQMAAFGWTSAEGLPLFPSYSIPFSLSELTYSVGVPVVGSTGTAAGYQRGFLDDFGDEWHVLAVGDDDRAHEPLAKGSLQASDGKIITLVVNPKTPAMTVRVTGNGEFYTTPPKAYLAPKIHAQTTYIQPGTGTVTFELRDIYGRNISYRINGGSWVAVGAATVTLSDSAFSSGSNTLEYRSAGFEANAKTRTIVKNPTHPSLAESHGNFLWGDATERAKIIARLTRAPYLTGWNNVKAVSRTFVTQWDANGMTPHRNPFFTSTYLNTVALPSPQLNTAMIGLVSGWTTVPASGTLTAGQYAKQMLLNGILARIDPVDAERTGSNSPAPSCEIFGAGYYQVTHVFSSVAAYDIIAGFYRSDQQSGGLSPIEDYYIRDIFANWVIQSSNQLLVLGNGAHMGLWPTARAVGALMVAQCLSEYSTPYYGTSGYGTAQTRYAFIPHATYSVNWRDVYGTTPAESATIPGTSAPSWSIDEPDLWLPGGVWGGANIGYFDNMNLVYNMLQNINARHSTNTSYPYMEAGVENAINGTLHSYASPTTTYYKAQPRVANYAFPTLAPLARAAIKALNNESTVINAAGVFGLVWYDDASDVVDETPPTAVSLTVAAGGTTGTLSLSESVVLGAGGSGGFAMSMTGGAVTATMGSPSGASIPLTFSRTINQGQTGTWTYTQPGNGIEDLTGNDMATATSQTVTNQSTAGATDTTAPSPNPPTLTGAVNSQSQFTLTSSLCTDAGSTVRYEFSVDDGATYSAAQTSRDFVFSGAVPEVIYSCRVRALDSAPVPNYTAESESYSVVISTALPTPARARRNPASTGAGEF